MPLLVVRRRRKDERCKARRVILPPRHGRLDFRRKLRGAVPGEEARSRILRVRASGFSRGLGRGFCAVETRIYREI